MPVGSSRFIVAPVITDFANATTCYWPQLCTNMPVTVGVGGIAAFLSCSGVTAGKITTSGFTGSTVKSTCKFGLGESAAQQSDEERIPILRRVFINGGRWIICLTSWLEDVDFGFSTF